MGTSVHDNVALPALALAYVVKDRDAARCLNDTAEASAKSGAEIRQTAGPAPISESSALRAMVAIDASDVVARRKLGASRRWARIVYPAVTGWQFVPARLGRAQQGKKKFPIGGSQLLPFRRQRRNAPI